jgi:hypothetical protein
MPHIKSDTLSQALVSMDITYSPQRYSVAAHGLCRSGGEVCEGLAHKGEHWTPSHHTVRTAIDGS